VAEIQVVGDASIRATLTYANGKVMVLWLPADDMVDALNEVRTLVRNDVPVRVVVEQA